MRILCINPWIYDFAAYDLWMKPLGLLYIARILNNNGFDIDYIDCLGRKKLTKKFGCGKFFEEEIEKPKIFENIKRKYKKFGITEQEFLIQLKKVEKPDVILVTSFMTYWYPGVFKTIELVKKNCPDVPVILGGIYAILCSQHAKLNSHADYVYSKTDLNEFFELISKITNKNISYPKSFKYFPYPYFELIKNPEYGCILTSTGCVYDCSYCASNFLWKNFVQRDPSDVSKEIKYFSQKLNIKDFAFYDDALLVNFDEHLFKIYKDLKSENLKLQFHTPNGIHARLISSKVSDCLFNMGFKTVRLGYEFFGNDIQKNTGGKVSNQDLQNAIKNLVASGFSSKEIDVYILAGFPNQKINDVLNAVDFVRNLGANPKLSEFSPIPNTKTEDDTSLIEPLLQNNKYLIYGADKELKIKTYSLINNY